jgi:EmrB/QacA subfamily drug resistance transporter
MVGIDGTIVNVALPSFVRELGASNTQLQWIVDAYTIVFASFLLIAGNTGDRLGRARCLIVGLVMFTAGSLGCSLVHTASALIFLRGVQGFGAAFIMPATLSIITNVFHRDDERARAIALWAGVSGLGVAIGPLVGGYLLEHYWWGSIFLVNVPIGIVAVVLLVPESRDEHAPRLDVLGTLLSTVGLIALLFGIIEGPTRGWGSVEIVGSFVIGASLLTAFVVWERRTDHPILDVTFFRNPRFTAASIAVTLVFFAMFGSLFFVSQYLQFVLGYTAFESGVRLLPVAVTLMIAAPTSAKLVATFGTKRIVALGLALVAVALLLFSPPRRSTRRTSARTRTSRSSRAPHHRPRTRSRARWDPPRSRRSPSPHRCSRRSSARATTRSCTRSIVRCSSARSSRSRARSSRWSSSPRMLVRAARPWTRWWSKPRAASVSMPSSGGTSRGRQRSGADGGVA